MFNNFLIEARGQQMEDERILQAQFFSRIAFIASQITDLDFATHRLIIEHGLRIGNTAAACVIEADEALQRLSEEIGRELMEISRIPKNDFNRIPTEFVHPFIAETELTSQGFLEEVLLKLSDDNAMTNMQQIISDLETHQEASRNSFAAVQEQLQAEIRRQRYEMNIVKAEIFPILEASLNFYRSETEAIVAGLSNCE